MSSFFKKTACVTGIILLGLFGLIGFYSTTLPDFYLVSKGSELSVNSFFTISSKPCESKVTVAVSGGSSGASRYTKNMLMLLVQCQSRRLNQRQWKDQCFIPVDSHSA